MEDNKKCTTIWLRPSVIRRMDAWLEEANCRSRSEFIEKAVRFYMGYLGTEDTSEYAVLYFSLRQYLWFRELWRSGSCKAGARLKRTSTGWRSVCSRKLRQTKKTRRRKVLGIW